MKSWLKTTGISTLILFLSFSVPTLASGGSQTLTQSSFAPIPTVPNLEHVLFFVNVTFTWDSDTWQILENHTLGLTIQVVKVDPSVINLQVTVDNIAIQLKSDRTVFYYSNNRPVWGGGNIFPINQLGRSVRSPLITVQQKSIISNTPVILSYNVQIPQDFVNFLPSCYPNPPTSFCQTPQDQRGLLYYLVALTGTFTFQDASGAQGSGAVGATEFATPCYISNGQPDTYGGYYQNFCPYAGGYNEIGITVKAPSQSTTYDWGALALPTILVAGIVSVGAVVYSSERFKRRGKMVETPSIMVCKNCGQKMTPNLKFCTQCGTPLT